jgi:hypothetical protein
MPMIRHVDYTPVHGAHVQDSALCATCHTLFTPILDNQGQVVGEFPEQVPYLEWRRSNYAQQGKQCQACHMPRLDTSVKISSMPPWLEPRSPFWKHQFVGGNAYMLELFADSQRALQPNAESKQLRNMAQHAREQLRRAAQLEVAGNRDSGSLVLRVKVQNLTGHKFPTGHPFRRAWLHLKVSDSRGKTVFESGAYEKSGEIRGVKNGHAPHYDVITEPEQAQIYQSVMAGCDGGITWSLLRGASYLKDNRIPPQGFANDSAPQEVAVCGTAESDRNFNAQGSGCDDVIYRVAVEQASGPLTVRAELLYQSVPPEAVKHLLLSKEPAATALRKLMREQTNTPQVVHKVELQL